MLYKEKQLEELQENQLLMRRSLVGNAIRMLESRIFSFHDFRVYKELYLIKLDFPYTSIDEIIYDICNNSGFQHHEVEAIIKKLHKNKFLDF